MGDAGRLPEATDGLLSQLFWRSSNRVAIVNGQGRIIITSKMFRDSFPDMIEVRKGSEVLSVSGVESGKTFLDRLRELPPGERFSHRVRAPFAGVENIIRIEATALQSKRAGQFLFLTEWIPEVDSDAAYRAMTEIEQNYRALQENLPVGIYRGRQDGIIMTANSALMRMMGFESFEELQRARLADVWVDVEQRAKMIERLREEGFVLDYEVRLRRADGSELLASFDARGTFDADGRLLYFDTIVQDITARLSAKRELERLARTDSLTGLFNRQHLLARFETEMARARRYGRCLSVMLIDLDHFKRVNDNHGHLAGDAVLVSAAMVIRETVRETDFAGRYGGEEFLVVLPETDLDGAIELAERLRQRMEETGHALPDGGILTVTCSVGVSEAADMGVEDLIDLADSAMYAAKRAGRNRVEVVSLP